MKNLPILLLALLMATGCQKKEESNPVPDYKELTDFLYLPVRDAEWRVHMQGYVESDHARLFPCAGDGKLDTAAHYYYIIKTMGIDTSIHGFRYYKYSVDVSYDYTKPCYYDVPKGFSTSLYLREDTATHRIYAYDGVDIQGNLRESLVADFAREDIGDEADVAQRWPPSVITSTNYAIIKGQKAKMWEVAYTREPAIRFFYKGYGIIRQTGVLTKYFLAPGAEPRSVELIYKGEATRFEFELHP